jgi:ribosomal protein S18 acetylase RimI-like enzyme
MEMTDYEEVMALWRDSEGIGLSDADDPQAIARYLARNPGASFVAREDGLLIGAVLCGHDGRRGFLHHLAVRPASRERGLGRALVDRCLAALAAEGITRCHLFVRRSNPAATRFWSRVGWQERVELHMFSREVGK